MNNTKGKAFLDSVHGYIYISSDYCKEIIDTPIFQRLRRIEQTSFRALCPSARHDRFIHSIGVYYMGTKIFQEIKNNLQYTNNALHDEIKNYYKSYKDGKEGWEFLAKNFEIACLLHDCGHAPFSHTFEKYYMRNKNQIVEEIIDHVNSYRKLDSIHHHGYGENDIQILKKEITNRLAKINQHELASAWLLIHKKGFRYLFTKKDEKLDPILAIRMIIGCKHLQKSDFSSNNTPDIIPEQITSKQQIENCFISLLNGHIIDADRLDYFARDRWATG